MSWPVVHAWSWLRQELDRWQQSGLEARFWWRDDDATSDNERLHRLLRLCRHSDVPLALAVIPKSCESSLVDAVSEFQQVTVLQHGYAHTNHAAPGELKLELGGQRDPGAVLEDLRSGFEHLQDLFGDQFYPVLVPPWNRIHKTALDSLPMLGLKGVSTYRVCKNSVPVPGLVQVNTHLDPVHWRGNRGFIGVYPAVAMLVQHLVSRRTGYRDMGEPTGILSHHLAYNEACWKFTEDLFNFLDAHPAVRWTQAGDIWGLAGDS